MNHELQMNQLFKFLRMLPEELLLDSIAKINYRNRNERRQYEKIKSLESKIRELLKEMHCRVSLVENIYAQYKESYTFDDSLSYENILSLFNAENCIPMTVYMLFRCCDDAFDQEHFTDFLQSQQFQNTVSNSWDIQESSEVPHVQEYEECQITNEVGNLMTYYIGYIENRSTYFNFKPFYIYDDTNKTIAPISEDTLRNAFPEYGSINLAYKKYTRSHEFLKGLSVDTNDATPVKNVYAVSFFDQELEDNDDEKITKKIDLQKLSDAGVNLDTRIQLASNFGLYKIVKPKDKIENESFAAQIFVDETDYLPDDIVLLHVDSKLFGPYLLCERPFDGGKYIRPNSGASKYVLKYYDYSEKDIITFEKSAYMEDPFYTDLFLIKSDPKECDVISDATLLSKLVDTIDFDLLTTNPEEFERLYSTSPFLAGVSEEIRSGRISKIQEMLKNTADYDEQKKKLLKNLVEGMEESLLELLGEKVKNSPTYKKLQDDAEEIQKTADELRAKNNELGEENQSLRTEVIELKEAIPTAGAEHIDSETISALEKENEELKVKVSTIENYEKLTEKLAQLTTEYTQKSLSYDAKVIEVNKKSEELKEIQEKVHEFIAEELHKADATKMLHAAFDPFVSNAMIEAASKYHAQEETEQYSTLATKFNTINNNRFDKDSLVEKLVVGVQQFRKYSRNEILNLYICFSQNFLTVFSGEPGTGKTSICNILAHSLGLNNFIKNHGVSMNRYVPVSVERGWSSKRDLIGYFNPLTKKYDRSNAKIYDGLMLLNMEKNTSRYPFVILLDEANLSPVEYYWADFMRAADSKDGYIYINIGTEEEIFIPKTLRFLATINNDQTTEKLSPRLIDRAWIVKLPKTTILESDAKVEEVFDDTILWEDIENVFSCSDVKEMSLKTLAEQIYKLFDEHHLSVSPRVQQSIKKYVCVAQEIMEDEIGKCNRKEKALDFAIVQKLLPKIDGYYKDYERLFAALKQICDDNNLLMTKDALLSMEEFQRQNMGYCQYLV